MLRPNAALLMISAAVSACSSSSGVADAGGQDGATEARANPCPRFSCGEQCCDSVGRLCEPTACGCPDATVIPVPFQSSINLIDPNQVPGALTAVALFTGAGGPHSLVVGYQPTTMLDMDLVLAAANTSGAPFAAIGWKINVAAMSTLTGYYATAGSVRFTRACMNGVAGTLKDLTFTEQTTARDQTPYPDGKGCSFAVSEIAFDIGAPCP